MRLEIIDAGLGIAAVNNINDLGEYLEKLKKDYGNDADFSKIAVVYMHDRDWIVVNKSHPLQKFYFNIIQDYLALSEVSRSAAVAEAPTSAIKNLLLMLNEVINKRQYCV